VARTITLALEAVRTRPTTLPADAITGAGAAILARVADVVPASQGDAPIVYLVAEGARGTGIAGLVTSVYRLVAEFGSVAEQTIVAAIDGRAGLASVIHAGLRPIAVEPIAAFSI